MAYLLVQISLLLVFVFLVQLWVLPSRFFSVKAVASVVWRRLAVAVAKGTAQCLLRAFPGLEACCSP